ncbi:hybrid signal transduction histidine kinase and diguanylate cyclase/phosphodiesterase [Catenovulum agarivorans DS-2]|uniref:histidine kinase n=1 Tax=Catenovulum agarivorans DS-2 TaxID=1328313 RepID=W7QQC6_9ALTE|nr:ATP-binding protein [Catenovulum agarivorans]EWH11177.1 hybrid signal transduction histidine kinase and diguanylate cyclase/phosphodiesterase [Catenovulum agarivorans DS-2]
MIKRILNKYISPASSFRRQLMAYVVGGIIVLSLAGSGLTAWVSSIKIKELIVEDAMQATSGLAEQGMLALLTGSNDNAEDAINQVLGFKSVVGAAVIDADQQIIANQNIALEQLVIPKHEQEMGYIEDDDFFWFWKLVHINQGDIGLGEFDQHKQSVLGVVYVKLSKTTLTNTSRDIFIATFLISTIVAVMLVMVVDVTVNRLTRPINELADTMEEAERTGQHLQTQVKGAKEIRQMSHAFNTLMQTLDDQDEQLRNHRDQLETEVKLRTAELVQARDSALTASRHKSVFLANITHELRTPIQAIIGYIDLVREELEMDGMDNYTQDLAKVQRNAERLLVLINSILDLSKVEAGRMEVKRETILLKPSLEMAIDTVSPLLDKNKNLFVGPQNQTELMVETDKEKLEQILINLLSNACKFTKNGTISLDFECGEETFAIQVTDTGKGIPADKLAEIFDEFRQVGQGSRPDQGSSSREFEGTGLGLAISQKFARLLGGEISVESTVGKGTCFTVVLPL